MAGASPYRQVVGPPVQWPQLLLIFCCPSASAGLGTGDSDSAPQDTAGTAHSRHPTTRQGQFPLAFHESEDNRTPLALQSLLTLSIFSIRPAPAAIASPASPAQLLQSAPPSV